MKQYPHLNDIYISPRLKNCLQEINRYPLTLISAPAGYGKTTSMRWWDNYRRRYLPDTVLYRMTAVDDNLTRFWEDICRLLQRDHSRLAEKMLNVGYPENGHTMLLLSKLWMEEEENEDKETYFVIDDAHILPQSALVPFLICLMEYHPEHLHVILLSRSHVFTKSQIMKLGSSIFRISESSFQLDQTEIQAYAECCGLPLSEEDAARLHTFSGGWVSLIYLIFRNYVQTEKWQFETADISRLIDEIMLAPLPPRTRDFLTVCSLTPGFTKEQAAWLWDDPDAGELLNRLVHDNAFIFIDPEGVYRCHNLLRRNTRARFDALPEEERRTIWERLGDWNRKQKDYFAAMTAYRQGNHWEKLMDTVILDRGNSFAAIHRETIDNWFESCPDEILLDRPGALQIQALQCFSSGDIPNMLKANEMLTRAVEANQALSRQEKDNFSGESQILLSFLEFNNIRGMSMHHRAACGLMDRESALVNHKSPWTFGSPSVLALYHRESGALDRENADMRECMPYYYQLTDCHGNGSEHSMQAETELLRGLFQDAEITYYQAARAAQKKEQDSILLTAEFTAMRLELLQGDYDKATNRLTNLRKMIENEGEAVLLPTVDVCAAWIGAILGRTELIPQWIMQENAIDNIMIVAAPIFMLAQGEALLAAGEWTRLISCGEEFKTISRENHMVLCLLYAHIQLASAYEKLGRHGQAVQELSDALELALPDGLILPFAEHSCYLSAMFREMQEQRGDSSGMAEIIALSDVVTQKKREILEKYFGQGPEWDLSEREQEIAGLAARRMTRKEIAEQLFLSENTVKVHLKHIFEKLNIPGGERNKSVLLREKLNLD